MISSIILASSGNSIPNVPEFIGSTKVQVTVGVGDLDFTINQPTNTDIGDLMIAFVAVQDQASWSASGWTIKVRSYPEVPELEVFTKTATVGGSQTVTFTRSIGTYSDVTSAVILSYRNTVYGTITATAHAHSGTANIDDLTASVDYTTILTVGASVTGGTLNVSTGDLVETAGTSDPLLKVVSKTVLSGTTVPSSASNTSTDVVGCALSLIPL